MVFNPCPCVSIEKGVKILAIFDAVLSVLNLGLFLCGLILIMAFDDKTDLINDDEGVAALLYALSVIFAVIQIMLAYKLYNGAKNKDFQKCRSWLTATVIIVAFYNISLVSNRTTGDFRWATVATILVIIAIKAFEIVMVVAFTEYLKRECLLENEFVSVSVPQRVYPVDNPPTYLETQNQPSDAELPPPPYATAVIMIKNNNNVQADTKIEE